MENTKSEIELQISARIIVDDEELFECYLYCVVLQPSPYGNWNEISRTEVKKNTTVCNWEAGINLIYLFAQIQPVRFEVYQKSRRVRDVMLAYLDTTISDLITTGGFRPALSTYSSIECHLMLNYTEYHTIPDTIEFTLSASNLDRKSIFKNDPYFKIYKLDSTSIWRCIYTSDYILNSSNPEWELFKLSFQQFCASDLETKIRVECYDRRLFTRDYLIGIFETTAERLLAVGREFELIHPKKVGLTQYRNSGILKVKNCIVKRFRTFLDFVRNGSQICMISAVDLGVDNRKMKRSAHNVRETERLIWGLGNIIDPYSTDKQYPLIGFNAQTHKQNEESSVFTVYSKDLKNLVRSYKEALRKTTPINNRKLQKLIDQVKAIIGNVRGLDKYYILLIFINGLIEDISETSEKLLQLSDLPIGVILVGHGTESYISMHSFYNFKSVENSSKVSRSICNLIRYKDYSESSYDIIEIIANMVPDSFMDYVNLYESMKLSDKKGGLSRVVTSASE